VSEKIDQYEANRRSLATAALAVKQAKIDAEKSFAEGYRLGMRDGCQRARDWFAEAERAVLAYPPHADCSAFIRQVYAMIQAGKEGLSRDG
jgi:hypothetical protein